LSERARLWGLRFLALAIALGLWYSVSFREREAMSERSVTASVSYNQPRGYVILNPVPTVTVRLRGSSKAIRRLNPFAVEAQAEVARAQPGSVTVNLGPESILRPEELQVVSIRPNVLRLELDREITLSLPVRPKLVGTPAPGAKLGEPLAFPALVFVTGPESILSRLKSLPTRPIVLDDHAQTFEEETEVLPPDPLIRDPEPGKVRVRVSLTPPRSEAAADSETAEGSAAPKGRR
jgi:YbbR domain-containing protein